MAVGNGCGWGVVSLNCFFESGRESIILGGWLKILSMLMYLKYFSVPPRKFTLGMYVVPKIYSFVSSTPVKLFSCL